METIEGNKLIAEFMGGKVRRITNELYLMGEQPFDVWDIPGRGSVVENFAYYSSWDWLMPVVEKIESQGVKIEIEGIGCDINRLNPFHPYNNGAACATKIESVWLAIVQFIQWYNTTKPQPNAK